MNPAATYCTWLVRRGRLTDLKAILPIAGAITEKRPSILDRCSAWWRASIRSAPSEVEGLFCLRRQTRKATMASHQRTNGHRTTSAAPRGRRVEFLVTQDDIIFLEWICCRYRLRRSEILRGLPKVLPTLEPEFFAALLWDATESDAKRIEARIEGRQG